PKRTFRRERQVFIRDRYRTLNEVRKITEQWLPEYNCECPHESLNNQKPGEYRQQHYQSGISKNVWN
ncbi:integrase core domain-containing protein, partial [Escherichia coli]